MKHGKTVFIQVQVPTVLSQCTVHVCMVNSFFPLHLLKIIRSSLLYNADREAWLLMFRGIHLKKCVLVQGPGEVNLIDMCHQGQGEGSPRVCVEDDEE